MLPAGQLDLGKLTGWPPRIPGSLFPLFKAALSLSAALVTVGLILDFAFVRVPKVNRHGWGDEFGGLMALGANEVAVTHTTSPAELAM